MLSGVSASFDAQMSALTHRLEQLHVIFAGGGANLDFLRRVVRPAIRTSGVRLAVTPHAAETPVGFAVEASLARMAVAMGGTVAEADWPQTEMQQPRILGLSSIRRRLRD